MFRIQTKKIQNIDAMKRNILQWIRYYISSSINCHIFGDVEVTDDIVD